EWPMSPLVTDTHLTLWPRAAHFAATPAVSSSQSSGCAPKVMMRSLPSAAAAGPTQAAVATNAAKAARAGPRYIFPVRGSLIMLLPPFLSRGVLRRTPEPPARCAGVNPAPRAAFILGILPGSAGAVLAPMSERPRLLNDVEAASLEELHDLPAGSTAAVVMAGTGIGAGFVVDGRPFRGARGWAGELGSIPIAGAEGVATLDQLASGASILKRLSGGAASV